LGLCWDDVYEKQSLVSSNPERAKRSFDDKVLEKAKTLTSIEAVADLYNVTYGFWTTKVLSQLVQNNKQLDRLYDRLAEKIDNSSQTCNNTIRVELQRFYFSDYYYLLVDKVTGSNHTGELTFRHFVVEQTPWSAVVQFFWVICAWIDARFAAKKALLHRIRLSPVQKVK
jgi:hypothetical protein